MTLALIKNKNCQCKPAVFGDYLFVFLPQPQPPFLIACETLPFLVEPVLFLLLFDTFFPPKLMVFL
jgi:hypothetical protein